MFIINPKFSLVKKLIIFACLVLGLTGLVKAQVVTDLRVFLQDNRKLISKTHRLGQNIVSKNRCLDPIKSKKSEYHFFPCSAGDSEFIFGFDGDEVYSYSVSPSGGVKIFYSDATKSYFASSDRKGTLTLPVLNDTFTEMDGHHRQSFIWLMQEIINLFQDK